MLKNKCFLKIFLFYFQKIRFFLIKKNQRKQFQEKGLNVME